MIGDGDNLISKHVCTNLPKVQEFPARLDLNTDVTFDTITASVRIQHLPSVSSSNVTTLTELYTSFFLSLTLGPKSPPPHRTIFMIQNAHCYFPRIYLNVSFPSPATTTPYSRNSATQSRAFYCEISDPSPGIKRTKHR